VKSKAAATWSAAEVATLLIGKSPKGVKKQSSVLCPHYTLFIVHVKPLPAIFLGIIYR
jgi:hypothetical protein